MNHVDPTKTKYDFESLNSAAWAAQFQDPSVISGLSERIIGSAPLGSTERAWGYVHHVWAQRFARRYDDASATLVLAEDLFAVQDCQPGIALCCELRARDLLRVGDEAGVNALIEKASQCASEKRRAWERLSSHYLNFAIADRFSRPEHAILHLTRAIVAARATGASAALANTLSMLGGKHAELNNYDTALSYCTEAFQLAESLKPHSTWYVAGLNLLTSYAVAGKAGDAYALARELAEQDELFYPSIREQSNILYARAFLLNGDAQAAQTSLNQSIAVVENRNHVTDWTAVQLEVFVKQKEWERARGMGEQWILNTRRDAMFVTPSDTLRIYRSVATACESLGDLQAALDYERRAVEYNEVELSRAALARRVAFEVEFDLERERAARSDADRKRLESEAERARLDELNRKLDAALQTRTRFLAAASHDLRQPAHALALYAQALEHENSRPALVDLSKRMRVTVGSLSNMFDGLLELARLDASAVKPQQDVFDLNELLARLCAEYSDRLTHASALLKFHRAKNNYFVRSDAVLIERMLRNLIGNAVKYAGEGKILVAARKRETVLAIEVRDAGPGMSAEEQHHVFDEFYRASSANERRDGLGLGLSIVERFARLLGAQVSVRSASGRGTTFTLAIPVEQLATRPANATEVEARAVASIARCIAVIDDDPDARESMALVLAQWGHSCVAGESAADVLAHAARASWIPDALISDFQLRDRNAIDDIAQLRNAFGASLPVLVASGSHEAQATLADAIPDAAYLPKPIRPLRLKSWIASLVGQ